MCGYFHLFPFSFTSAYIYMGFGEGGSWNSGRSPCLWNWETQTLFELQITREQATLFPWSCKLQPPCAVHIKYQSRLLLLYIINQRGHGLSQTFLKCLPPPLLFLLLTTPMSLCYIPSTHSPDWHSSAVNFLCRTEMDTFGREWEPFTSEHSLANWFQ